MPYLVLGIAIIVGVGLLILGARNASARTLVNILKWCAAAIGLVLILALAMRGGLITLAWVAAALIPVILRWRSLARMARGWSGPQPGQTSDVNTRYLRMSLDHDTGDLDGTVLEGAYRGRRLQELNQDQVVALLQECRIEDEKSAQILETYLDRIYGAQWRSDSQEDPSEGRRSRTWGNAGNAMSADEAYGVLGLEPGATEEKIKEAHRKLMVKLHPDQGGSTYLAAKINQAKDLLLRN